MQSLVFILLLAVGCGVAVGQIREYFFIKTPSSWYDAQTYCRQNYRDLATVSSTDEYNQLLQSGSVDYGSWTGLRRTSGRWTWSDGEPLSFPNWFGDSTFLQSTASSCAVTSTTSPGFKANYTCTKKRNFYCYQYLVQMQEQMTWDEAQEYCRIKYSGLASMTSGTSLRQLNPETEQARALSVWTGLRFMNGIWFWVSGEQLCSLDSMPSCPALSHRCGSLNTITNILENRNCNDSLNFVCH